MTLNAVFNLPFDQQILFFRKKINIPTRKWDDLWKDQHAKGFMIAGAMKADLLNDFRQAVDKAIASGSTLADFRKDFDRIVETYGWSYKGGRNWRTRVIYDTNIRTSFAAGRWQQLTDPDVVKAYGYLTYRHGDSVVPRPLHLAWDGTTLPVNDPWWNTHFVPNGWGCKCKIFAATREEWQAAGSKGQAPPSPINPKTGEPAGIDKGWGYNVGKAADANGYAVLNGKFATLPYGIARKWIASYVDEPAFERFIAGEIAGEFPVAILNDEFRTEIGARSQAILLSGETLSKNKAAHPELQIDDYKLLPDIIENAQTVVRDGEQTMVFIRVNDKIYHAVVKTTKSGETNYMTSFRLTDMQDVERMKRKGKVLKDEL